MVVQTVAWRNSRLARCVLAFPLVTIFLVFFAITASSSDSVANNGAAALRAARRELIAYLAYSAASLIFAALWLAGLPSASAAFGCKVGVCVSGLLALGVWALCLGALVVSQLLDYPSS